MPLDPFPTEILTAEEMARADRLTIESGVPGMELMQNAAAALVSVVTRMLQKSSGRRVLVLCGPGNNGGDGYVAARLLRQARMKLRVGALTPRESLRGDALTAANAWDGPLEPAAAFSLEGADIVVDALFGTGLSRDIEGKAADLILRLNHYRRESGTRVVAVDIPSGIDGSSGAVRGVAVEADVTVTFFRLKNGHLLLPGRLHCGELSCAHIGIRSAALDEIKPRTFVNAPNLWRRVLPAPRVDGHKYSRGHAVVVSGGFSFTGAARLAAHAALRAGAGLVTLASPREAMAANAPALTSVMLRECEGAEGLAALLSDARKNVVALGPGLGVGEATRRLVETALSAAPQPPTASARRGARRRRADELCGRGGGAAGPHRKSAGRRRADAARGRIRKAFRGDAQRVLETRPGAQRRALERSDRALQRRRHGRRFARRPRLDPRLRPALARHGGFGRHAHGHDRGAARARHGALRRRLLRGLDAWARRDALRTGPDRRRHRRDASRRLAGAYRLLRRNPLSAGASRLRGARDDSLRGALPRGTS